MPADMAELVDALASGVSESNLVEVQVLLSAPILFCYQINDMSQCTITNMVYKITSSSRFVPNLLITEVINRML